MSNFLKKSFSNVTFCFLLLSIDHSVGQKLSKSDSINFKLNQMGILFDQSNRKSDSLNRELQFYKVKEDYFVNAVDRQGSHFEFLLAFMLGIAGLVSWKVFDNKITSQKQYFEDKINIIEKNAFMTIEQYKKINGENLQKINIIIKKFGHDIAHDNMDKAMIHLNNGDPVLSLEQIFNGIYKLVQVHKHLKEFDMIGVAFDIKIYIKYANEFLKQCLENIQDPSKKESEKKMASAFITSNPLDLF